MSSSSAKKNLKSSIFHSEISKVKKSTLSILAEKKLPENFAAQILNLEILISRQTITTVQVQNLIELYSNGVEFYESKCKNSYNYFMNKIREIFTDDSLLKMAKLNDNQIECEIDDHFQRASMISSKSDLQTQENQKIRTTDLEEQTASIQKRLSNRKRIRKLKQVMNLIQDFEGDFGGGTFSKEKSKILKFSSRKKSAEKLPRKDLEFLAKKLDYESIHLFW